MAGKMTGKMTGQRTGQRTGRNTGLSGLAGLAGRGSGRRGAYRQRATGDIHCSGVSLGGKPVGYNRHKLLYSGGDHVGDCGVVSCKRQLERLKNKEKHKKRRHLRSVSKERGWTRKEYPFLQAEHGGLYRTWAGQVLELIGGFGRYASSCTSVARCLLTLRQLQVAVQHSPAGSDHHTRPKPIGSLSSGTDRTLLYSNRQLVFAGLVSQNVGDSWASRSCRAPFETLAASTAKPEPALPDLTQFRRDR